MLFFDSYTLKTASPSAVDRDMRTEPNTFGFTL